MVEDMKKLVLPVRSWKVEENLDKWRNTSVCVYNCKMIVYYVYGCVDISVLLCRASQRCC